MGNFYHKKDYKYLLIGLIFLILFALVLSGCSSSGGDDEEEIVQTTVENLNELNNNLNSGSASIDFANDISGDAVVDSRSEDLLVNLADNQLSGNFKIDQSTNSSAWNLVLNNGEIDGDLIIDDPSLSFILGDNLVIAGTTNIKNVSEATFINNGEINNVNISDNDGSTFDNQGKINGFLEISSEGGEAVNLKGTIENDINITGNGTRVRVTAEASVNRIVVSSSADSVEIEIDEGAGEVEVDDPEENAVVKTILERVPELNPAGGEYYSAQNITISSSVSGDTIYYTDDGSEPSSESKEYTSSILVDETTTIKAKIINKFNGESEVVTEEYIIAENSISGTVSYSGGTDNVKIALIANDNIDNITSFDDIIIESGPKSVDSNGEFNFINVTPGNYYLVAFKDQNDNNELDFYDSINEPSEPAGVYLENEQEAKISISQGDYLENIDISLDDPESNFITGKVDNISDTFGETYVLLVDSSKELASLDPAEADYITTIESENKYLFDNVDPGNYYLLAYNDQNGNNEIGADLFDESDGTIPAEPLGFYGGYPQVINYSDTSQPLEDYDITISKKMLAVSVINYDQENETSIPLVNAEVSLFNADNNNLIASIDSLFETTVDENTVHERDIAFAFLTGLDSNSNYYVQANESNYRGTLSPVFNFNEYDIISTGLELFIEGFITDVFNDSTITSNDALVLAVIEEKSDESDSLLNKSVSLEGPAIYSPTENSQQLGYLASDGQYLNYDLNSFVNYDEDNSGDKTFVVGVKKAEPGEYDIYLEGDSQSVDNIYVKEGFLTSIFDYVN